MRIYSQCSNCLFVPLAQPKLELMRIVGSQDRIEIELDAAKAWRRGRVLDAMLRGALVPVPVGFSEACSYRNQCPASAPPAANGGRASHTIGIINTNMAPKT